MPSHLMSMPTDSGQEDHVSMAASVAMRAYEAADLLAGVLAIEMAFDHVAFLPVCRTLNHFKYRVNSKTSKTPGGGVRLSSSP